MPDNILVAYASRTGFTVGVAEAIGKTLADSGLQVEVRPMAEVTNIAPFQAVIAGSAIQNNQWLPEAVQFVQNYRLELVKKPFAAYLVCMTLAMPNNPYQAQVAEWIQPVRALVKPVSIGLFAGGLDIGKIPSFSNRLKFKMSVRMGVWSEGDHRDWNAIRAWTESTRPLLIQ